MAILDTRAVWAMSGGEILAELDTLHTEVSRLQTRRLHLIGRLDEIGYAKDIGAGDTTQLLALRHRLDKTTVRRDVKLATALPKYKLVNDALPDYPDPADHTDHTDSGWAADHTSDAAPAEETADPTAAADAADGTSHGSIDETADGAATAAGPDVADATGPVVLHPAQAEAIVAALEHIPTAAASVEDLQVAEAEMVTAARLTPPRDLRRLGHAIRDLLDTDGPEPKESAARAKDQLWLSPADHGVRFGGFLSNENAELFRTLIEAAAKPRKTPKGELDPRSRAQRQADALVDILHAAAATGGDIPAHGGIKAHVTITITLDDLKNAGAHATGDPHFGDGLSAAEIRRLACDAAIIPVVLGSNSEPLDVGREHRFVTPAIRRALIARDKGCIIPGCEAPPGRCDAHHVQHWANDGPTSVDTCALACKTHHRATHRGEWIITITNGVVHVTRPPWAEPGHIPPPPWNTNPDPDD